MVVTVFKLCLQIAVSNHQMQETIKKGEEFQEEVEKSEKDVRLIKKGKQYTAFRLQNR